MALQLPKSAATRDTSPLRRDAASDIIDYTIIHCRLVNDATQKSKVLYFDHDEYGYVEEDEGEDFVRTGASNRGDVSISDDDSDAVPVNESEDEGEVTANPDYHVIEYRILDCRLVDAERRTSMRLLFDKCGYSYVEREDVPPAVVLEEQETSFMTGNESDSDAIAPEPQSSTPTPSDALAAEGLETYESDESAISDTDISEAETHEPGAAAAPADSAYLDVHTGILTRTEMSSPDVTPEKDMKRRASDDEAGTRVSATTAPIGLIDTSTEMTDDDDDDEDSSASRSSRASKEGESGDAPTYTIVDGGSRKGRDLMVDDDGYAYNVRKKTENVTYWWCSVRNRSERCSASVVQRGDVFARGPGQHIHPADPSTLLRAKCSVESKRRARQNIFASALSIVEDVMLEENTSASASIPSLDLMARQINRLRTKFRPQDPTDLEFEIDRDFIGEEFVRADLRCDEARHVVMASDSQLKLLREATCWYVDGTFKVVKKPFYQLFTIHAFLENDGSLKQTPLLFVLMSRRTKLDYTEVFNAVRQLAETPAVSEFVADFEIAMWEAIYAVFPAARISGCNFHLTQAVFRKAQNLGLQTLYRRDVNVHTFVRSLMALPFLPARDISAAFAKLSKRADTPELAELCKYYRETWLTSPTWNLGSISVYRKNVRTNNDVEGYHRRLNARAKNRGLPFYVLVALLVKESKMAEIKGKLVSLGRMRKFRRASTTRFHEKVWKVWDEYKKGEVTPAQLVRRIAAFHGPSLTNDDVTPGATKKSLEKLQARTSRE